MMTLAYRLRFLFAIGCLIGLSAAARGQSRVPAETLTLEQAVALALRDNSQIKNTELDVSKAGEELAATRTRRLPSFSFDIIGSQQLKPIDFTFERGVFGTFPGIGPIPSEDTRLSTPLKPTAIFITRVSQPLSQLYRVNLNLNQLKLKAEIAQEESRSKRQQVVRDVKRAYFAVLQTQSALESAAETVRLYKELDRLTGDYLAQRVVLRTESLDVKSRLAKSEYDTLTLTDQLDVQKQQLNMLLGRDVLTEFAVTEVPEADDLELDVVAARTRALQQRSEVREAQLKVKQSEGDRRIKKAEYIPEVSIGFQYIALRNFNSFIPGSYMNVGVTFTWEFFDWGRKKHELAEKGLTTEQAQNGVRDAERAVVIDVNDKFNKLRQARQLLKVSQLAQEASMEGVRVTTNRYKVQMSLLKDVLQAQTQLEQANHQWRQALLSFWTARAEFENATGEEK
ncbi:MAG TPA: TolC family protein [Blastocatellia bacterium]|nr:TolC family protein [Blastocatellia bacterium]